MKRRLLFLVCIIAILSMTGCHKHVYSLATCTTQPTCYECGKKEGVALGHSYLPATCAQASTCSRCGDTIGTPLEHTWVEATCTEPKTCSVCGATEGEALGHKYKDATCTEPEICEVCGDTRGEELGHNYSEGSCTEDKKCKRCKDVIKATGHEFSEATCDEPRTCKNCGETDGEALGHDLVDGICSRCGLEIGSIGAIKTIANLRASCETDYSFCVVNADIDPSKGNPYDVTYDYGTAYDAYVDACDWSLIFDANYYISTYPILAKLYNKDKDLLLRHFQTVGVHEGRQASKSFSVSAYKDNCAGNIQNAFGDDYAPYAIYYMINYSSENQVEHLKLKNGKTPAKQQRVVLTVMQAKELKEINNYRREVGAQDLAIDPELCAYANYRAWINAHDDWAAHDWAKQHSDKIWDLLFTMNASSVAENTVTVHSWKTSGEAKYVSYRDSKEHYDALIKTKYNFFGTSNFYNSLNENKNNNEWRGKNVACTFDCFVDEAHDAYNN